jgi:hypothetical protein
VELIEQTGTCKIAPGPAQTGVTIYALVHPGKYALEGRESAEGNGKSGLMTA